MSPLIRRPQIFIVAVMLFLAAPTVKADGDPLTKGWLTPRDYQRPEVSINAVLEELRLLIPSLVKTFPPNEYLYIGIGKSPAPIIEALRAELGLDSAWNFPIKGAKFLEDLGILRETIPAGWRNALESMAHFLPPKKLIKGRKILIIDVAISGRGFFKQMEIFDAALRLRDGESPILRGISFYYSLPLLHRESTLGRYEVEWVQAPPKLAQAWMESTFKWWAEFDSWEPLVDAPPLQNERFPSFQDAFTQIWQSSAGRCSGPLSLWDRIFSP